MADRGSNYLLVSDCLASATLVPVREAVPLFLARMNQLAHNQLTCAALFVVLYLCYLFSFP